MAAEVRTLEEFRRSGRTITAFCSHYYVCSHSAQLRLDLLAIRLGWAFDFYSGRNDLSRRLRCQFAGGLFQPLLSGIPVPSRASLAAMARGTCRSQKARSSNARSRVYPAFRRSGPGLVFEQGAEIRAIDGVVVEMNGPAVEAWPPS